MKQKLLILGFLVVLVALLAGLNAASYTQKEKTPDNEVMPHRSSFNSGSTGTQGYYTLLSESGHNVVRWQEPPAALLTARSKPGVFVITGNLRRELKRTDADSLLRWVSEGGRLVVIDREPPESIVVSSAYWKIAFEPENILKFLSIDPSDQQQMTADTPAARPAQPSTFTAQINAVQPSRLASSIVATRISDEYTRSDPPPAADDQPPDIYTDAPNEQPAETSEGEAPLRSIAPIVHLSSSGRVLMAEVPFGEGKVLYVADPYIVSNGGIAVADNAQLAVNLVQTADNRLVAFDEYHQGYANDSNRFLQFFAGTPVIAMFVQAVILVGFLFYSQSRRFARPVPEPEPDRLSKLEYVAAMAELQERTRAYDLAVENIYTEFRRRAARTLGIEVREATAPELAARLTERTGLDRSELEACFAKCEDIMHGERTSKREVVRLIDQLRGIEQKAGLDRIRGAGGKR